MLVIRGWHFPAVVVQQIPDRVVELCADVCEASIASIIMIAHDGEPWNHQRLVVVNLLETLCKCDWVMDILAAERLVKHTSPVEIVAGVQNHERVQIVTQCTHDICYAALCIVVQLITLRTGQILTVHVMHRRMTWATRTTPITDSKEVQIIPMYCPCRKQMRFHAISVLHEKQGCIARSLSAAVRVQLALAIQVRKNRASIAFRAQIGALIESLPVEVTRRSPWRPAPCVSQWTEVASTMQRILNFLSRQSWTLIEHWGANGGNVGNDVAAIIHVAGVIRAAIT